MAQASAMVDVVRAEAGSHQLLEHVRLFVRAFGGAEAGERTFAILVPRLAKSLGCCFKSFFPGGFTEDILPVFRIDNEVFGFRNARLADQRLGKTMLVLDVIE